MGRASLLLLLLSFMLLFQVSTLERAVNGSRMVDVGVVLDLKSLIGKISNTCIDMALHDFYRIHSNYTTRLVLHKRDSHGTVVGAAFAALDLLKNVQVQAIVGPQTSKQAEFVADLGGQVHVPIISFSATSPSLSSAQTPYFIRTAQSDSSQVKAIASIVQSFGWREVVVAYEDTEYGKGVIPYLIDALQEIEARVPFRSVLHPTATDDKILMELYKLMTMQTRIFVVHMNSPLGSRFFFKAKEVGMMSSGYVWIITVKLTSLLNSMDSSVIDSMQGVLGIEPFIPQSGALHRFKSSWKRNSLHENHGIETTELNMYGLWAYDTIWALAMAVEKANVSSKFQFPSLFENLMDPEALGISLTGSNLRNEILETRLEGLSGEFQLVDGELQSSIFRIVNLIGKKHKVVGFWSTVTGILHGPKLRNRSHSAFMNNLRSIMWPGESSVVPKGWVIPTNERRLKVGVPIAKGFGRFIEPIKKDPKTNRTIVTGYSIDVFDAVMKILPYAVNYEYVPFENALGQAAGSYDDLIYQVHLGKFDAMVGDITIIANRSVYIDFTLPYSESGIAMIVGVKDYKEKTAWVFLKPMTPGLWITSMTFFVLTGMVVWILEHRKNPDFRGSPAEQIGTFLWFSFSTVVFAQRERVSSNLSRLVVIIWVFVVLILSSSYTANLSSILTVQQFEPSFKDIDSLIKSGEYVGYTGTSFVKELLKCLNFNESKIREYATPDEYADALLKGSQNGGVDAVFDEIPYIEHYLSSYCNKFTMVGPTYKTGGFGFVFPKGSPLVTDVSKAILNITEGDEMLRIEDKWLGSQTSCLDKDKAVSSSSLTLNSFGGLFLITGSTSVATLIFYFLSFFHHHKNILRSIGSENSSIWQRMVSMARYFDEEDLPHVMSKLNERSMLNRRAVPPKDLSPTGSPLSSSTHLEGSFSSHGDISPGELNVSDPDTFVYEI